MFDQFSSSAGDLWNKMGGWINEVILALPNIVLAVIILAISIFVSQYLKKLVSKAILKTSKNQTVASVLSNIAVAGFMILALFIILNVLNLSEAVTALLGTAGVIGLAVGLALQDPLINLFSGVLMSVRDYYQVGDLIETNGYFGKIQKITLRSTIISQPDGQEVIIPNKEVIQNPLKNFSHNGRRRIDIACGVAYGDDLEQAQRIAIQAIEDANIDVRNNKPIEVFFTEFGDSSINFTLRFWQNITSQRDYLSAQSKAIIALKKAFDKAEITIPFPITTLDFGVVGGRNIDDVYPTKLLKSKANITSNGSSKPATNGIHSN